MRSSEPPCARCPRQLGVSCCEVKDDEQLATLTWADVERLQAATGLSVEACTEWEWLNEEEVAKWSRLHPRFASYFGASPRRLTLKRARGACVFHGSQGCTLTAEQRPTACRLYPFEVRSEGGWGLQVDRFGSVEDAIASGEHACLAVEEADSFETLWAAFGTTPQALEQLSQRLEAEARAHGRRERGD
jgi:Fe-S-cluster containining protein